MSGLFDGVDSSAQTPEEKDVVRGARMAPLPSDVYPLVIKAAFGEKKQSGALFVNVHFEVADGPNKDRKFKISECVASGDAKGNKTYYEKKSDKGVERFDLPGFALINSMAQLVAGKGVLECKSEKRTIPLYDFDKKVEVPTDVDMLVELVNKGVYGCVLHRIEDKTAKNAQSGEYEATGKTYETNVVDKFLDARDGKTVSEIKNNLDAAFKEQWLKKWKDQVDDQSTEVKNAGLKGAPQPSGAAAEKPPLFG